MKKILIILAIILGVILIIGLGIFSWVKGTYNRMVIIDEEVNGSWAQVEVVRVAEDQVCTSLLQFLGADGLDRALCAHRCKDRHRDVAVRRSEHPCTSQAVWIALQQCVCEQVADPIYSYSATVILTVGYRPQWTASSAD